jgi:superfamily II DNA/RNA helicase
VNLQNSPHRSFGFILALLSDFRVWRSAHESHKLPEDPSISSLVIVPHRDLAYQLSHWIQLFAESKIQAQRPSLPSIVQVLVRSSATPLEAQLDGLKSATPHILIGTPQVLLDNYLQLKLHKLKCVVVDEVDYLIESVPNLPDTYKREKLRRKIQKHPGPTRQLLNLVLAPRIRGTDDAKPLSHKPQVVLSSATLRSHLNRFLFQESGWLTRGNQYLVKIKGDENSPTPIQSPPNVSHSVLVVSGDGKIRNIEGSIMSIIEDHSREPSAVTKPSDASDISTPDSTPQVYVPPTDSGEYEEGLKLF